MAGRACCGIDVGAEKLHGVVLDADLEVVDARIFALAEFDDAMEWAASCERIAGPTALTGDSRPAVGVSAWHCSSMPPRLRPHHCAA